MAVPKNDHYRGRRRCSLTDHSVQTNATRLSKAVIALGRMLRMVASLHLSDDDTRQPVAMLPEDRDNATEARRTRRLNLHHPAVQDANGRPLPGLALEDCVELFGDEIDGVVRWDSGIKLSDLARQAVRLRFVMRDADVYSLRFAPR